VVKKSVLLVDDSSLVLDLVGEALRDAGYDARVARNLAELESSVAAGRPDLILMDVQMPEAFGDDLAYLLRCARGVGAPIYLFSGLDEDELARRAAAIEIEGFISKRIGVESIVERVKNILGDGT
jgi:DNA-binding response OmpR family regulator